MLPEVMELRNVEWNDRTTNKHSDTWNSCPLNNNNYARVSSHFVLWKQKNRTGPACVMRHPLTIAGSSRRSNCTKSSEMQTVGTAWKTLYSGQPIFFVRIFCLLASVAAACCCRSIFFPGQLRYWEGTAHIVRIRVQRNEEERRWWREDGTPVLSYTQYTRLILATTSNEPTDSEPKCLSKHRLALQ